MCSCKNHSNGEGEVLVVLVRVHAFGSEREISDRRDRLWFYILGQYAPALELSSLVDC